MGVREERNALLSSNGNAGIDAVGYGTISKNPSSGTPTSDAGFEDGALRDGPPPELLSPEVLALLMQYAGIGFVNGVLPAMIYPVLQGYLNAEGTIVVSATLLVQLPWSYKVFLGVLSDCFPIGGFRRRPYMLIGWLLCCCMLFMMAAFPEAEPYYGDPSMQFTSPDEWTQEQRNSINPDAPESAGRYVIPMMMAAFGYLLVEVPADAVTIEYSQRESIDTRGHLQSWIHSLRMGFSALGALVVAVAFNGVEYGGSFDFSLSFPQLMFMMGCLCIPLGPAAWFLVHENQVKPPKFRAYMLQFWKVLQKRAVYQVAAYKFFSGVFNNFNIVSSSNIKLYWVHATPFNASIMAIVGTFTYAGTLAVMAQRGLHWNWHIAIAATVIFGVVTDSLMTMAVTWDIVRSQWLWLGVPVIGEVPHAVRFIVSNYIVVELIEQGTEGALYGLLTTTNHVAAPFGRTTAKIINARFHVWKDDIRADTYETRRDVTYTIWLCYGMKLVSLVFLPLLPNQRETTQALRRQGGVSRRKGMWTVVVLMFALVWFTVVNVLSMNPATECWAITGGCEPNAGH
ncbi:Transmembrane protein [Phytophthora megakarya]|uniref:Transmembrane protein n=1 Tax=Phytophthora megakarya TaxID=4795 RepID=A0A225WJ01_9STRA|nr:Transmembrane protein [Phytophthora megakarya]